MNCFCMFRTSESVLGKLTGAPVQTGTSRSRVLDAPFTSLHVFFTRYFLNRPNEGSSSPLCHQVVAYYCQNMSSWNKLAEAFCWPGGYREGRLVTLVSESAANSSHIPTVSRNRGTLQDFSP